MAMQTITKKDFQRVLSRLAIHWDEFQYTGDELGDWEKAAQKVVSKEERYILQNYYPSDPEEAEKWEEIRENGNRLGAILGGLGRDDVFLALLDRLNRL